MSERVIAAMSGGVDSAAVAVLLCDAGYAAAGGTMRFFDTSPTPDSLASARGICDALGIDHYVFDLERVFREEVIRPFAESYMRGETPNPCVECNRRVKFAKFLDLASEVGYGKMATGHYAMVEYDHASGRWLLKKGADREKDQSYFLYALTQAELSRTLFPLGSLTKKDAREITQGRALPVASRPDSQDVCFLPDGDYRKFICREFGCECRPGDFIDTDGRVIGRHDGAMGYTTGQRRGLGVSAESRLYVLGKDMQRNTVTLGTHDKLFSSRVRVRGINLVAAAELTSPLGVEAKLRYSRASATARLIPDGEGTAVLEFDEPQRAPTVGQAAVFYDGDTVIGGGTIC